MKNSNKSERRINIVKDIMRTIKSDKIFGRIKYKQKDEAYIKQYMHQPLIQEVTEMYKRYKGYIHESAEKRANVDLKWEQDQKTIVHNFLFMGTQHRPDFVLEFDDISIAIEVKRGSTGQAVREGMGQCIVYNTNYDFSVYLFIDTSEDDRIKNSFTGEKEQDVVKSLWDNYNCLFEVV